MKMVRLLKKCLGGSRNGLRYYTTESRINHMPWSTILVSVDENKYFNFKFPGLSKVESDESLSFFANMPGVKKEHVEVSVEQRTSLLSITGEKYEESYCFGKFPKVVHHAVIGLPKNVHMNTCMIKSEMSQDGMFEVTLPKDTDIELKKPNFFTNIYYRLRFKFFLWLFSSIPTVILTLARPLIRLFCPLPFDSFTMYKKETPKSLHISVTPGLHKWDHVTGGVCVSLNMHELGNIHDVKSFIKYDTLFIQGKIITKTNKVRYVTCIRLPDYYTWKRSMIGKHRIINEEMQDGMYKATIPYVTN